MTPRHGGRGAAGWDDRGGHDGAGAGVLAVRTRVVGIYVDRASQQWVVRDADGNLWLLPSTDNPWGDRRPFTFDGEPDLEPVPGHYRDMLGLPH